MRFRLLFTGFLMIAGAASAEQSSPVDGKAEEVIARSRNSTATYTIYWRVSYSNAGGKPDYAWSATFRKGSLVRLEDVQSRVVADCAAGTGTLFDLGVSHDNYRVGKKVAQASCGIDSDRRVRSARWLGEKDGKFGRVDEVEIVDEDGTFIYQVGAEGELLGINFRSRGFKEITAAEPMKFERTVPSGDIFSRLSLANSKVPKQAQSRAARGE